MRPRKRIARNFLAAFHAFQQKRIARASRDPQVRAYRCQQIRGKHVVNRYKIALLRKSLKFPKVRLDHARLPRLLSEGASSARNDCKTARRMAASGALFPVH